MSIRNALMGWQRFNAQIHYYFPDHPGIVSPNWFLWQEDDRAPDFPRLNAFLRWWDASLDGKIHLVKVWATGILDLTDLNHLDGEFRLN